MNIISNIKLVGKKVEMREAMAGSIGWIEKPEKRKNLSCTPLPAL